MLKSRLLLVEDDPAVRRYVDGAVASLGLELVSCATVEEGMAAWQAAPFPLVLADITFPDGSGLTLIRYILARLQQPASVKIVVFSGGLHRELRADLKAMGVWRCLSKPASQSEIEALVREGMDLAGWPEGTVHTMSNEQTGLQPNELAAIEEYFDGDRPFYEAFRLSCIDQFSVDLASGDAACQIRDAAGLRRTAHSLKSVLRTLGYADHSVCARAVEEAAQKEPWELAESGWQELRLRMVQSFNLKM